MVGGLDPVPLAEVSFEGPDGDRTTVNVVAAAGRFTGRGAHTPTYGSERIGLPGYNVPVFNFARFDRPHIATGIRVNWTGCLTAYYIPVVTFIN